MDKVKINTLKMNKQKKGNIKNFGKYSKKNKTSKKHMKTKIYIPISF